MGKMTCELNLNFLKELERETVLQVLYRDQMVRKVDEERIRYFAFFVLCHHFSLLSSLILFHLLSAVN